MRHFVVRPHIAFAHTLLLMVVLSGWSPSRAQPVGEGTRMFVTKAYPSRDNLVDADFQQLANAGFTVIVKRWFEADDLAYIQGAAEVGLSTMIWRYGLLDAPDDVDRTITRQGKPTRYALPFSDHTWDKVSRDIVALARLSLAEPSLKGVVFDCEVYDRNKMDGFSESYDDATFAAFLRRYQKEVPEPLPPASQRREILDQQQLLGLYIQDQTDQLAQRVTQLRRAVDGINPRFQFGVYGWGVMIEPILRNLATEQAPVLHLNAMTYGRTVYSNAFDMGYDAQAPDRPSLKWALTTAAADARRAESRPYPVVSLAGHYPQSPGPEDGTQFRFTVRQCFNSAAYADGYWVWTDAVTPEPYRSREDWLADMLGYFAQANAALDAQDWAWSARQPMQIPDPQAGKPGVIVTHASDGSMSQWDGMTGQALSGSDLVIPPTNLQNATPEEMALRLNGWNLEWVDQSDGTAARSFPVGAGLLAFALGDVDGMIGDELVTLGRGWIRVWEFETGIELLRFPVGADARTISIIAREATERDG